MAENSKPKRRIRQAETVRDRAAKADKPGNPRRIKQATSAAGDGIKTARTFSSKEYHPIRLPDNKVGRVLNKPRRVMPRFFREAWQELRQVTWPNRSETVKLTTVVLIFAVIFGGIVALTDYGLEKLFREVLLK